MDIQKWFDLDGSYSDGVKLYALLPNASHNMLRGLKVENFSNSIKLRYELKRALNFGNNVSLLPLKKVEVKPVPPEPKEDDLPIEFLIEETKRQTFAKETMAMYPLELHSVYRERITTFYTACELKFKLNRVPDNDSEGALKIILELENLWSKNDKCWMILEYWKENNRLMPVASAVDYSKFSPMQLFNEKGLLEVRISKRKKTISGFVNHLEANPNDNTKRNLYNKKLEELERLILDLETIKMLIKNE